MTEIPPPPFPKGTQNTLQSMLVVYHWGTTWSAIRCGCLFHTQVELHVFLYSCRTPAASRFNVTTYPCDTELRLHNLI